MSRTWLVCAMRVGPSITSVRFFGEAFVRRVAPMLPGVPVAVCERDGQLVHPGDIMTTTATPTERLTAAETRHDQIVARLEAARIALEELRAAHAKAHEAWLAASASAELEDGERPSRAPLIELERQLPEAKDSV